MAVMYARSTLTTWPNTGGIGDWSATSGGASNGSYPDSTTDVIFDANSGSARSIVVDNAQCRSLVMAGANPITFTDGTTPQIVIYGGAGAVVNMTTAVSCTKIAIAGAVSLNAGNCNIFSVGAAAAACNITLTGNLNCNNVQMGAGNTFNASSFNVTAVYTNFSATSVINMGSGTWTFAGDFNPGGCTSWTPGTATVKLASTTGTQSYYANPNTVYNLEIATTGTGAANITANFTVQNTLKINPGAKLTLGGANTLNFANIVADGGGLTTKIESANPGTAFNLNKTGGGLALVNKITFSYVNGSPANTIKAMNSTNTAGNTNILFIGGNSNNLSFI